jgi:hypothetical protein
MEKKLVLIFVITDQMLLKILTLQLVEPKVCELTFKRRKTSSMASTFILRIDMSDSGNDNACTTTRTQKLKKIQVALIKAFCV